MTAPAPTETPTILTPTDDPRPVELAVAAGIAADHDPETFLWITFHLPCGGARVRYEWTAHGADLGDRIDRLAQSVGLDCADWFAITGDHVTKTTRGRVEISAHPLRPILRDVESGQRDGGDKRLMIRRVLGVAARLSDLPAPDPAVSLPRWLGVGPALLNSIPAARRTR